MLPLRSHVSLPATWLRPRPAAANDNRPSSRSPRVRPVTSARDAITAFCLYLFAASTLVAMAYSAALLVALALR